MIRSTVLLTAACLLFVAGSQAQEGTGQKEAKLFEGDWQLQSMTKGGQKVPDEAVKNIKITVKGDTYTVKVEGNVVDEGTFKVNPSKNPKWIDITPGKGEGAGKTFVGIYEIKGDMYTVCFAEPGEARPKAFTSEEGSKQILQTARKIKAKE